MTKKGANAPFFVYSNNGNATNHFWQHYRNNATEQPLKIAQWYTLNAIAKETGTDKI